MSLPTTGYDTLSFTNTTGEIITDLVLAVDLQFQSADFKTNFNSNDGGRIRASKSDGITELACDCVDPDSTGKTGQVYINWGAIAIGAVASLRLFPPNTNNPVYLPTDTYGSNNAYPTSVKAFYPDGGQTDRTVNDNDMTLGGGVVPGDSTGLFGKATSYNGTDKYGTALNTILTSRPISILCMHNPIANNVDGVVAGIFNNSASDTWMNLRQNSIGNNILSCRTSTFGEATGGSVTAATWNTIAGSAVGVSNRKCSADGSTFVSNTTTLSAFSGLNTFSIGRLDRSSPAFYYNGLIQQVLFVEGEISQGYSDIWRSQRVDNDTFWGAKTWVDPVVKADPDDLIQAAIILGSPNVTSGALNLPDNTLYVLAMGQSNMLSRDNAGPKSVNPDVEIANTSTGNFEVWDLTSNPPQHLIPDPGVGSSGPVAGNDSVSYFFANKISQYYGVKVKVLFVAWGGVEIAHFMKPSGAFWLEWESQISTFGADVPRIDLVLWLQGEGDSSDPNYDTYLTDTIADYRGEAKTPSNLPWINSEIFDKVVNDALNANLRLVASNDDTVWTTSSVGLTSIGDNVHFDSPSLLEIGGTLWPEAFVEAIPTINENAGASPDDLVLSSITLDSPLASAKATPDDLDLSSIILDVATVIQPAMPDDLVLSAMILGQTQQGGSYIQKISFTSDFQSVIQLEGKI